MPSPAQCEFVLLRYVPDAIKNEFINIGVVLIENSGNGQARARFARDWRRVQCLDPDADIAMLQALAAEIQRHAETAAGRGSLLEHIQESCSNLIQIAEPKACLAPSPALELEKLAQAYLEPARAISRPPRLSPHSRRAVARAMQDAFSAAGVWGLLTKDIAVSDYSHSADPLKIDCGYQPNGIFRMFHAVSFDRDASQPKALVFSFPQLRAGMERIHHAAPELTAIAAEGDSESAESARFGIGILQQAGITLAHVAQLPELAERARVELRA